MDKAVMIEVMRALQDAMVKRQKKSVSIDVVSKYVKPEFRLSTDDTLKVMNALIAIRYIRYNVFNEKTFYCPSKLGAQRWEAYLGANLIEIQEESERRINLMREQDPPWSDQGAAM